jgi:hypothetical protein
MKKKKVDIMLGPHWFMLVCTYAIVIGLSVVIYGVVLNEREAVIDLSFCWCAFSLSLSLSFFFFLSMII